MPTQLTGCNLQTAEQTHHLISSSQSRVGAAERSGSSGRAGRSLPARRDPELGAALGLWAPGRGSDSGWGWRRDDFLKCW